RRVLFRSLLRIPAVHEPTGNATRETAFTPGQNEDARERSDTVTSGSVLSVADAKRQKDGGVRPAVRVITRTPPAVIESASLAFYPESEADTSAPASGQALSVIAMTEEQPAVITEQRPVIPQETGQPAVSEEDRFLQLLQ